MTRRFNVVGAVIVSDERVLVARRGPTGSLPNLWEFPGGKIEHGESPQVALGREIREELLVDIQVGEQVTSTVHDYDFGVVMLTTFYCELRSGVPQRTEHAELRWLAPDQLFSVEWAPADLPAVRQIQSDLRPGRTAPPPM